MSFLKLGCYISSLVFAVCAFAAPVAQNHQLKGLSCEGCHTQMPFADYNKCIGCHGGKVKLSTSNPQHSALKTADVPCSVCHKQFAKQKSFFRQNPAHST